MQSLEGFQRRFGPLGRERFLRRFPTPLLLLRAPGLGSREASWVAAVRNRPDEAAFQDDISVGRAPDNDIVLPYDSVSKHHLQILPSGEGYTLTDLNAKNGTTLNGLPLAPYAGAALRSGDVLGIGTEVKAAFLTAEDLWQRLFEGRKE